MSLAANPPIRNELLRLLRPETLAHIIGKLTKVNLPVRRVLVEPSEPIANVVFIESGWASIVAHLEDGGQAEIGMIGREGMVGLPLVMGVDTAFSETFMQSDGTGYQMSASSFKVELEHNEELRRILFRYAEAMNAQTSQTAACNGCHDLEARLARWLLMVQDRFDGDVLPLTQEFLAMMLCVYRPTLTVIAGMFQRAGFIKYTKGSITILDRSSLELTACSCYTAVKERFRVLLYA
jgi:CRP-like cAMP-binding protein